MDRQYYDGLISSTENGEIVIYWLFGEYRVILLSDVCKVILKKRHFKKVKPFSKYLLYVCVKLFLTYLVLLSANNRIDHLIQWNVNECVKCAMRMDL